MNNFSGTKKFIKSFGNMRVLIHIILAGVFFWIVGVGVSYFFIDRNYSFEWLFSLNKKDLIDLLELLLFCVVVSGIVFSHSTKNLNSEKLLRKSEDKYRAIFNNFRDLYTEANIDGTICLISPSAKEIIGYSAEELIGKNIQEIYHNPQDRGKLIENIMMSGEIKNYEVRLKDKLGNVIFLWLNAKLEADSDGQLKIISVARNVTGYKKALGEIQKLNEELERRVADRTIELQSAVNELEAFCHTVSHDLKTPLRAIEAYNRIILEDYSEVLDNEVTEMINCTRKICGDMVGFVDKLLEYSTTTRAELNREEIDTTELFETVFKDLKSVYPERNIELIIETELPAIEADRILIKYVIYNVLANAIKFTKVRERALIYVGCTFSNNEYVFYVRDNGIGFDMEFSNKLFEIFERLHTSEEYEGRGMGLSIVQKLIRKHGGNVWIEGKVDQGAALSFSVPITSK